MESYGDENYVKNELSINRCSNDKYNIIMTNEEILRDIGSNDQTIEYIVSCFLSDKWSDHQTLEYIKYTNFQRITFWTINFGENIFRQFFAILDKLLFGQNVAWSFESGKENHVQ